MKVSQYLKRDEGILFLFSTNVALLQVNPATDQDVVDGGVTPAKIKETKNVVGALFLLRQNIYNFIKRKPSCHILLTHASSESQCIFKVFILVWSTNVNTPKC